ncbi:MAG: dihydrolipoyl dehydrogenase [Gammaproteobacteria bacterium]
MKKIKKEVVVIGAGTSGLSAYRAALFHTEDVLMIEGGPYGTTCARVGCMPSKLLIAAAEAAHSIEKAPGFGVYPGGKTQINGREVMDRVKRERDRFVGFVLESVDNIPTKHKQRGYAHFLNDHTLQISAEDGDDFLIEAERIVIATGSRPVWPESFNDLGDRLIINDDVFEWDDLPESVAVFGPGVIGLELGQALHRLGVKVLMFGRSGTIGPLSDPDIQDYSLKTFADEFYLDTKGEILEMGRDNESVFLKYKDKQGQIQQTILDYVLATTGRRANVDNLGIENTSLQLDEKNIPIFDPDTMQCGQSHIFIAGDVNDEIPLLHEAADQGKIAGDNAGNYPAINTGLRRALISVVFSDPQIATVGSGWKVLQEKYTDQLLVGEVSFESQGRSRVMLKNKGLMHVYAEQVTGNFLGAEIIGPAAEHLAHLLSWALQNEMTISEMLDMPFYHPVIEEGLRTALRDVNDKIIAA